MGLKLGLESLLDFVDDLDLNRKIDYCDSLEDDWSEPASSLVGLNDSLGDKSLFEL